VWYFLVFLVLAAVIAGLIWAYRKKKEKRDAERAKQFDAMLAELKLNPQLAAGMAAGISASPAVAPQVVVSPVLDYSKKERLLSQRGALLYFVFKAGLPDHEIFANLTLADLIDIGPAMRGFEREQHMRKLVLQRFDLVVCTKRLEVIAAVLIDDSSMAGQIKFAQDCLQRAGVRMVRIDPAVPPRHQQIRELIYGSSS
jgi:hypothetical protein